MSERVTVRVKTARSATANPLDERIDPYQGIGRKFLPRICVVGSATSANGAYCGGNASKEATDPIASAGSTLDPMRDICAFFNSPYEKLQAPCLFIKWIGAG
jgi:hypothetical protein